MKSFVVVATKGRAKETFILLNYLEKQTFPPELVVIVGSDAADVEGLREHPLCTKKTCHVMISSAGSTVQRNAGLEFVKHYVLKNSCDAWFVAYFDDDFRPASSWLEKAAETLVSRPHVASLTGHVLADGVNTEHGLNEEQARFYIDGNLPPQPHWTSSDQIRYLDGVYGCNMAFNQEVSANVQFDERLPLYAWQEDFDYASRAKQFGQIALIPACRGVHLGASKGRTSGVKFGYSQIANPIYLVKKGSMSKRKAWTLITRNIASNVIKTLTFNRKKDYFGRLRGNSTAAIHLLTSSLDPMKVIAL